ncbi:MAG: M23 family metallopeptidase [Treponema sp.]|nr:M23 family metallopeptidase [Treponema sp.]
MNKVINGYNKMFRTRTSNIITTSILCFTLGLGITSGALLSINKIEEHKGIGGYETVAVEAYDANLSKLLVEPSGEIAAAVVETSVEEPAVEDSVVTDEAFAAIEEAPASDSEITYLTYRVKKGDMIGYIADEFDITQDTIISVNNIKQSRLIQPGQYLKIPSMPGILYTVKKDGETPVTIAEKYEIDAEKCAMVNSITQDTALSAGSSLFVPDAALDWATRQEINGDLFHKPLKGRYWLSSPYGWRDSPFNTGKRTFHGGVDMAIGMGTPIYAALDGTVIQTGYNATYGNFVIIQHHSGYKTLYGHMSQITCKKGNFVYTNTQIGKVGSTGMSTGPHLHFTVYKNGKSVNPMTLIN